MTYCFSCSCSCFSSFSYFISYSCCMNTAIHIAFPIFFLVSCLLHMAFHRLIQEYLYMYLSLSQTYTYTVCCLCIRTSFMYSCFSTNQLYSEIGIIPIESSKLKLWHFHAKLVILPILHSGWFEILIFQCPDSMFDTGSLYSFKTKVLRVLLQLESLKSEHRNSRYVLNNPDYFMIKIEAEFGSHITPL